MKINTELSSYVDSGFPIIYINSFEESKVDGIISSVIGGRKGGMPEMTFEYTLNYYVLIMN